MLIIHFTVLRPSRLGPRRWEDHDQACHRRPQGLQHRQPALNHPIKNLMMIYETRHSLLIGMWWRSIALSSRRTGCCLNHLWVYECYFPGTFYFTPVACRKKQNLLYILWSVPVYRNIRDLLYLSHNTCDRSSQDTWTKTIGDLDFLEGQQNFYFLPIQLWHKQRGHEVIPKGPFSAAESRPEMVMFASIMIRIYHAAWLSWSTIMLLAWSLTCVVWSYSISFVLWFLKS